IEKGDAGSVGHDRLRYQETLRFGLQGISAIKKEIKRVFTRCRTIQKPDDATGGPRGGERQNREVLQVIGAAISVQVPAVVIGSNSYGSKVDGQTDIVKDQVLPN